jgi:hypothetical protein
MNEHDRVWIKALEIALSITVAEHRCDRELGIPLGSAEVDRGAYQIRAHGGSIEWAVYGELVKIMGWVGGTRHSSIHAILVRIGWPTVLVVSHGRGYVAGYVSDVSSHESANKENTIHWKCDFELVLRVCLDVLNGKLTDRHNIVRTIQQMDPST